MKREISSDLIQWKNKTNRKPLIVRGARQVGKTYIIREFGNKDFEGKLHEINLEKNPDWHSIFKTNFDVKRIISELELLLNANIDIQKDLLFIDEIQSCPEAILSLRYFYEEMPEMHVIAAGSLLEFALQNIPFPVGRVEVINMYPMNFSEFLLAAGKDMLSMTIHGTPEKLSDTIHQQLLSEIRKYFFIGGMPECVQLFSANQKFREVYEIQNNLISTYRQDFLKYSPRVDTDCLNQVMSNVAKLTGSQLKYSKLSDGFTNPTIKKAYNLLETAKLITKVPSASASGLPLSASASDKIFKSVFLDIGLMVRLSGISIEQEYKKTNLLALFQGALAEQFIGQELRSFGIDLYYWRRDAKSSNAETDFLISVEDKIIPIEVKSGSKGKLRSLHILLEEFINIDTAFVFSESNNIDIKNDTLKFLPLYYVYHLINLKSLHS